MLHHRHTVNARVDCVQCPPLLIFSEHVHFREQTSRKERLGSRVVGCLLLKIPFCTTSVKRIVRPFKQLHFILDKRHSQRTQARNGW